MNAEGLKILGFTEAEETEMENVFNEAEVD